MSRLICNLPAINLWVRKEYLRDHEDGHGEFVKGVWISCKSLPGRAFYFETYLPEYGAMFDKLPISAFVSEPKIPNPDLPLYNLQFSHLVIFSNFDSCRYLSLPGKSCAVVLCPD